MNTKPPSRLADQFVVRLPEGMRDQIADQAKQNNRSMNAEIVARLDSSFRSTPQSFVPEIRFSIDTGELPISWDEIHEVVSAIRKKLNINAVSLHVNVLTPELISSSEREKEAADLAAKLRASPTGAKSVEIVHTMPKPPVKRVPRKSPKAST